MADKMITKVKEGGNKSNEIPLGVEAQYVKLDQEDGKSGAYGNNASNRENHTNLQDKIIQLNKSIRLDEYSGNAIGEYSTALGKGTQAIKEWSHAEGRGTTTNGKGAHAEGYTTSAQGDASHAEGYLALSEGIYSHAEGDTTRAKGKASHAEGGSTLASGDWSHAEGCNAAGSSQKTTAEGIGSHAEGGSTQATGRSSHAEGDRTIASGEAAHAEGCLTVASGDQSHAEGDGAQAQGIGSHAEGYRTSAEGDYSHAEGYQTSAIAIYSHVEGFSTIAQGDYAHAEGEETIASGDCSHAEGVRTQATGLSSHAEGSRTSAYGMSSHAEGYQTQANGEASHAEGYSTVAQGVYSHAEGYKTTALGNYSHVEGVSNIAGKNSHVEGGYHLTELLQEQYVLTSMDESVSITFSYVDGNSFHWQGYKIKSPSLVIDNQTYDTYAYGELNLHANNIIHPYLTLEPGYYQGLISAGGAGYNNIIYHKLHEKNSDGAFEIYSYEMSGSALIDLHVIELRLFKKELQNMSTYDSFDEFSHIQGKYSMPVSNCAHIVGAGTSDTNRKNIHTLDWDGNAEFAGDITLFGCGGSNPIQLSTLTKGPLIIQESKIGAYSGQGNYGDKILDAIQKNRQILILLTNQGGSNYSLYSPVITYHLPHKANTELSLFYLPDGISPTNLNIKEAQFKVSNPITFNDNLKN